MCRQELWPASVSHSSFLNGSLSRGGGKHKQKIAIHNLRIVLQNFCVREDDDSNV